MKHDLRGAVWRFAVFTLACLLGIFALLAIFAQLRFEKENAYTAQFSNITGLKTGDFVRVAGVEVGKVDKITLLPDSTLDVEFGTDTSVVLTEGSRAAIRYDNLLGDRYLALEEGVGGTKVLRPGATIPMARTEPALDLDALIGGFRPLFRALNPEQVNALSGQLITALQGQGGTISSFLAQTASVTNTLADRDQLIGQVINNLNTVLGSLGDQSKQFDKAITSLSELVDGLAARKTDISTGLAHVNEASSTVADLLSQSRPPFKEVIAENDRASGIVVADHDYFDNMLNTLPDKYQILGRLGLYGDYFSYYLCDAVLKLNGKGGQPVYVKVAGQDTGRCAPK
ncbi:MULTISPECIES: virulence factor Mce family protein [unclassified Mycobacterium]|uniref:virulence factor Mce family protein n=1 Tax=unclassified Mycobacterium TaxID=2642494 RepID=UPI0029C8F2BF|nr:MULTISPECIES: virulence factor Mce family protein [unclassified Mycobacterium]